jgi:hypothetical protein
MRNDFFPTCVSIAVVGFFIALVLGAVAAPKRASYDAIYKINMDTAAAVYHVKRGDANWAAIHTGTAWYFEAVRN